MDIIQLSFLSFIMFLIVQIYTLKKFTGGWKNLTLVSAIIMAVVFMYTAYALFKESNLWPLLLLFASPVALVYQFVLFIFFLVLRKGKDNIEIKQ